MFLQTMNLGVESGFLLSSARISWGENIQGFHTKKVRVGLKKSTLWLNQDFLVAKRHTNGWPNVTRKCPYGQIFLKRTCCGDIQRNRAILEISYL